MLLSLKKKKGFDSYFFGVIMRPSITTYMQRKVFQGSGNIYKYIYIAIETHGKMLDFDSFRDLKL